jgi:hypothetical protein
MRAGLRRLKDAAHMTGDVDLAPTCSGRHILMLVAARRYV